MSETKILNIRMPAELKKRGMQVLEREGVTVSDAVRGLFSEMERTQGIPDFAKPRSKDDPIARKREILRSMVGTLPHGANLREARADRLEHKSRPGVRA